ncbi:hypothetical protein BaRGS_00004906 [Batillaria attramentaria]|uniref:F-box domain-containing protein n=1 Tax=Batillaria attramentaria TaxID=370345 RepID=A0ABD0LWL4_9CAEN
MDTLPPELLCYILSKLDGYSLGRASQVCCKWRDMVNILSRGFNIWLKCCAEDWDLDSVVSFSQQMCLLTTEGFREAQARKEDWAYWRNMYAEYCRYRLLKKWTLFRRKIDCQDKPRPGVTSVAVDVHEILLFVACYDECGCVVGWTWSGFKHKGDKTNGTPNG